MGEKLVVIGSNSFSGAYFSDYALDQGAQVWGVSRSPEPIPAFLPYKWKKRSGFEFVQGDLNNDLDRIMGLIDEVRPEYVVNFAAQSMVAQSWDHPEHWFMTNAVSTVKFHDRLRKLPFLRKYVHVSTPEVYGTCQGLIGEDAPMNPSTPYAVSRAAADMSLLSFHKAYKFPVVFTRAANVFGPGQQLYRIVPRAALYIRLGRKIQLHGGGTSIRSFIHMRDVSDGTWRAMLSGEAPEVFHLSTEENISIREVVEEVCRQAGAKFSDHVEIVGERLGKDGAYLLDSRKAIEKLGWSPKISFKQGVQETIAWIDENLEDLKKTPFDYIHKP